MKQVHSLGLLTLTALTLSQAPVTLAATQAATGADGFNSAETLSGEVSGTISDDSSQDLYVDPETGEVVQIDEQDQATVVSDQDLAQVRSQSGDGTDRMELLNRHGWHRHPARYGHWRHGWRNGRWVRYRQWCVFGPNGYICS